MTRHTTRTSLLASAALVAAFASTASAQAPPAGGCTILDANTPCGRNWDGYPILSSVFPTVADFSNFVQTRFIDDAAVTAAFRDQQGCSGANLPNLVALRRYHVGFWCARIVDDAIREGCQFVPTIPPQGPILCQEPCAQVMTSLKAIVENPDVCPATGNQTIAEARSGLVSTFQSYCDAWGPRIAQNGGLCTNGTANEEGSCGKFFFTLIETCSYFI
ncbi:hypothetical protein HK102_009220 [Quaeritorhiza haematococci]|nr:hypothetical protein HK102_009220 [Quaeritorhiza haematococci]